MAKRITTFKIEENHVRFWIDAASSNKERDKLIQTIYEVLSIYELDFVVEKQNLTTYIVKGLQLIPHVQFVLDDILEFYIDWYRNRDSDFK